MPLGILLIVTPVLFTAVYVVLGLRFSYPGILREPTGVILERFAAGGSGLVLLWWAFAMSALLFVPVAVLSGELIPNATARTAAIIVGVLAGLVQALGLLRWVFLVPHLARSRGTVDDGVLDLVFQSFHRYLGVAVGEHLGYLTTGAWTLILSLAAPLPLWLTIAGVVIAAMLILGSLEFVGPFEREGWRFAGLLVTIGYTAWSAWLLTLGVLVLVSVAA
jgi:hypothetical protein